jgi:hypothetical protein
MQDEVVVKKKWLTNQEFLDLLGFPGVPTAPKWQFTLVKKERG